jgi:cbb3-type cytochrome oxidase subunit 3
MTMLILRSSITVALFAAFIGLWVWAWNARRRDEFDSASRLVFDDDASPSNEVQP